MARPDTRPISFTYAPASSMWVVTLHSLFLYSDQPLPCHSPSYWLRLFSNQTFSHINTQTFSNLVLLHTYTPTKMEECSETSEYKTQTLGNYPEESIQHSEHGESLKSRIFNIYWFSTAKMVARTCLKFAFNCTMPVFFWYFRTVRTYLTISIQYSILFTFLFNKIYISNNAFTSLFLILPTLMHP